MGDQSDSRQTILIVDDEEGIRNLLGKFLERAGYDVLKAADGEEGIEVYRENADRLACSLVDVSMPGMDGIETCRRMRAIDPDGLLFVCSGMMDEQIRAFCEDCEGAPIHYVSKPFEFAVLVQKIRKAVGTA